MTWLCWDMENPFGELELRPERGPTETVDLPGASQIWGELKQKKFGYDYMYTTTIEDTFTLDVKRRENQPANTSLPASGAYVEFTDIGSVGVKANFSTFPFSEHLRGFSVNFDSTERSIHQ